MTNPNPRDVQVLPIATNTTVLRARSWTRLRFEIEYALARGTTSNSYVISGDKVAVIDPPPETFSLIYLDPLRQCLNDWERLDYVILGHFNPNRVATLKALLDLVPKLTFVCSLPCAANLRAAFPNRELKIISMRGKETLDLGKGHILRFFPIPSPRWPTGLCTYDEQTQILYSNKLFGTHLCGDEVFDEDWDLLKEDQHYYFDCLMAPHATHVQAALEKLSELQVRMYATIHGPLIRYGLLELAKAYEIWSKSQTEREITVALLYASAYGNTATLAQAFALGLTKGGVAVESINCEFAEPDEVRNAIEKCDGFIMGSPTIGGNAPTPIHTALGIVLAVGDNSKLAGVFGSYGWSGEAFDLIEGKLKDAGYRFGFETLKARFKPTDVMLKECEEMATDFAQSLRKAKKPRLTQAAATQMEQAVGRIVGSVCVVTAKQGEVSTGMLGAWVSQATFNPPGITVAIAKERAVESIMHTGGKFVLNILGEENYQDYMKHFRKNFAPGEDRFKDFSTAVADNGCAIITDSIAYLECSVNKRMECGDHWVVYAIVDNGKLLQPDTVTAMHHRKAGSHY
ncbi:MAG: diflavin flavoprotein [Pelatocladus maniniholoensis HA4357-MV3]|jgi:flavorubredoxin/flavin reductase (DIM6/NTAB) family NADH-FMN oxidoreductase RutF|uniref:Diflavin flavoprotein n=1 Tax=Pelatocladus maniniholoensis HA4357-MV3 TaxID=1117104 RepID=A0A9E3LS43_9NOST|nr:diflavin flavoprotein [Pelatocladus maniniholoensis HA4357-MV3]BAZ65399.1 flavin reductase domain-containing protein [Fischerella sp. NIES-4106]